MEREIEPPVNFRSDPLNYFDGSLPRPQSPLIDACNRSSPGSLFFSLTPLVVGENRLARLAPAPKRHHVHYMEDLCQAHHTYDTRDTMSNLDNWVSHTSVLTRIVGKVLLMSRRHTTPMEELRASTDLTFIIPSSRQVFRGTRARTHDMLATSPRP
ncbi:hypothetical protein TNCV_3277021 [Trichonephila clavipes]|nr:hypothetical protein TNCV_3277021 [Trichonephila clavipes]